MSVRDHPLDSNDPVRCAHIAGGGPSTFNVRGRGLMTTTLVKSGFAMCLTALVITSVHADVVELTTGERIEGKEVQLGPEGASVEVGGQTLHFERSKVRTIHIGTPAQSSAPRAALAADTIQVLKGLQSVTTAGVNYQGYAPRVLDAKVKVDEYLRQAEADKPELRTAIDRTIGYYVLASAAWNAQLIGVRGGADHAALGRSPLVAECAPLMTWVNSSAKTLAQDLARLRRPSPDEATVRGMAVVNGGIPLLWQCASENLSHAESLFGKP
jgi:hypothetical protein